MLFVVVFPRTKQSLSLWDLAMVKQLPSSLIWTVGNILWIPGILIFRICFVEPPNSWLFQPCDLPCAPFLLWCEFQEIWSQIVQKNTSPVVRRDYVLTTSSALVTLCFGVIVNVVWPFLLLLVVYVSPCCPYKWWATLAPFHLQKLCSSLLEMWWVNWWVQRTLRLVWIIPNL